MGIAGVLRGGIQRKLILSYLALGIIPMVLMGFISYYNSSSILVEQTRGQMNGLARKAIEQVESQIAVHKDQMEYLFLPLTTILNFMEVGMEIDGGSREQALKEIQKIQKKSPAIRRVRLFDAKGAEKFSTHAAGAQASSQSWFQAALNGKETSVSDIFRSQETKEPVMLLAKSAATQDGKAYAVLAVDLASSQVLSALENTKMDLKGGYLYIVNKDGWVVSHPDKTKVLEVNVSRDAYGKEILQKKTGMVEYDSEGKSRLASFQEYPPMNWIIVSTVERGVLFHSVDKVKTLFLLLGVAFAGVSLFLAVVMSIQVARPVGQAIKGLNEGAEQVTSAAGQVSASSKTLADGSSAQAAGLEEASSSLEEMSSMTRKNAENANEAKNLTGDAKQIVENVNRHMTDMSEAIAEVLRSSEETKKIIKTIDEISFQTNLLALNAAVEAARAGEAGAGFAVVADEVRNLAIRATEAAKNTSALIERTLKSVKNGSELTLATKEAFGKNVEVTEKIRSLIEEIAVASGEQAEGIAQVSRAVADMDKVTQTNAASAEESASAAEQLNGQAERVKEIVEKLARLVRGQRRAGLPGVLSDRKDSN